MSKVAARIATTEDQIDAAIAKSKVATHGEPYAVEAFFDRSDDKIIIRFNNSSELRLPRILLQGLERSKAEDVANIEILGRGTGLHWPRLDIDHYIPGLLAGIFGTRRWMADLGRKGGRKRTPAKSAAARANGKRGGRPALTKRKQRH